MIPRVTLPQLSPPEVLLAAQQSSGRWDLLITSAPDAPTELAEEYDALDGHEGACTLLAPPSAEALLDALASTPPDRLAIIDARTLPDEAWATLGTQRDRLARAGCTIVVATEHGARALLDQPHLSTWITRTARLREEPTTLDDAARNQRLSALRAHYKMSDDEFIARWSARKFDSLEPAYAEWLLLLNRSDLLAHRTEAPEVPDATE